jgi:hypothetical protein
MRDFINIVSDFTFLCETVRSSTWYHGTTAKFSRFSLAYTAGQLGIHLGSREQAEWRLGDEPGFILHVRADVSNLIRLQDEGGWYGDSFVEQLRRHPKLSHLRWYGSMSDSAIRQQLLTLGYEGVIYKNMHEGEERRPSIIVFNPTKLTIVKREEYNP